MGIEKTTTTVGSYGEVSNLFVPSNTNSMTAFAWHKINTTGELLAPFGAAIQGGTPSRGIATRNRNSSTFNQSLFWSTNPSHSTDSTIVPPLDTWFSVLVEVDATVGVRETRMFLDGILAATATAQFSNPIVINTIAMVFFAWNDFGNTGIANNAGIHSVAEFAYWDSMLSAGNKTDLQTSPPDEIGVPPVAYYPMLNVADVANQGSGTYNNMTFTAPADFSTDDHPYGVAPPPSAAATTLIKNNASLLSMGGVSS